VIRLKRTLLIPIVFLLISNGVAPVATADTYAHHTSTQRASIPHIKIFHRSTTHHRFVAHPPLVSDAIMQKASRVDVCEESGNWHVRGWTYSGGLGWMNGLWSMWKAKSFPASMADATPAQQAWAMAHFVNHTRLRWNGVLMPYGWWPDQAPGTSFCTGGY
jgi:hypothetical protein